MRPALAIALVLAAAACKKAPAPDASASLTSFEWKQVSPDGKFEIQQRREASGCSVQVVSRPGDKPLWVSRLCLPAPSGLFFLSPGGDKLLVLDLFPADVPSLVPEWLGACAAAGLRELRIVHGKGTGALRRTVEALLARHPLVAAFRTAGEDAGGWGATLVTLR